MLSFIYSSIHLVSIVLPVLVIANVDNRMKNNQFTDDPPPRPLTKEITSFLYTWFLH